MLHPKLIHPKSIVVIGGSDNIHSPGGRVLKNLIEHKFSGELFVVNPKQEYIQGKKSYKDIREIPEVDLAIIAIASRFVLDAVKVLTELKNTQGFIIFSAGFSEKDEKGTKLEQEIVRLINEVGGSLLGPNNIGLINKYYTGVFTTPIPKLHKNGVDFISGSGATAVFIIEAAKNMGLTFSSVFTVGNSAQTGVEEILEYFDQTFEKNKSSNVKLLYVESIKDPYKFLKHTSSLIKKGCKIAAIKAGSSEAGNRAASSHTGAIANSDVFVDALFNKAGIIRCFSRHELISVAGILLQKESKGKNIAIITHAGGPAVMLTDILSQKGLNVPYLHGKDTRALGKELFDGSSVTNPIDFLATGTAQQLDTIIEFCENKFDQIDAMAVIFGSPGLTSVYDVYDVLDKRIKTSKKPIYAILPSVVNVKDEITQFIAKENIVFTDEVLFGLALSKVYNHTYTKESKKDPELENQKEVRKVIEENPSGYLSSEAAVSLLELTGINFVTQFIAKNNDQLESISKSLDYPVVLKVVGPLHKSDVGGVVLNISNKEDLFENFKKLMQIEGAHSIMIQSMKKGLELFVGAKKESNYPHVILCGIGGIFVEVIKDVSTALVPIALEESIKMIKDLKAYPILKGMRGQTGIDIKQFAEIVMKISNLLLIAPEITELDINPLIASEREIIAVDVRIRIEK